MKLNYDTIKSILEHIESISNGRTNFIFEGDENLSEISSTNTPDEIAYHLNLLIEENFIKGQIGMDSYVIIDLNLSGHQLLETMRSDTIWNKIKSGLKNTGIETLKQIPGLAIQLLMQGK